MGRDRDAYRRLAASYAAELGADNPLTRRYLRAAVEATR